jgi:hypothetical protein
MGHYAHRKDQESLSHRQLVRKQEAEGAGGAEEEKSALTIMLTEQRRREVLYSAVRMSHGKC